MLIDNHTHTVFSPDSTAEPEDMIKSAIKNNVEVYTITDHCDVDEYEKNKLYENIPMSIETARRLNDEFSGIKVLAGMELGQPEKAKKYAKKIMKLDVDCIICSVHSIKGYEDFYWANYLAMSDDEIYTLFKAYYNEVKTTVKNWRFDTLAHITYPYRYLNAMKSKRDFLLNPYCFDNIAEEIFTLLAKSGRGLELNGNSILQSEEDKALNLHYMKMFRQCGGEYVTVGSDAHTADAVSRGVPEAYGLLRAAGYEYATYFEKRKPVKVLL